MQSEFRKKEAKRAKESFQEQAFKDANQWRSFLDDVTKEVMFLSNITGREGLHNVNKVLLLLCVY